MGRALVDVFHADAATMTAVDQLRAPCVREVAA